MVGVSLYYFVLRGDAWLEWELRFFSQLLLGNGAVPGSPSRRAVGPSHKPWQL